MTKKSFLVVVLTAAISVFLAACAPKPAETVSTLPQPSEVQTQAASGEQNIPAVPTYNEDRSALFIPYKTGDGKAEEIVTYQKKFAALILAYKEAMLSTYALAYIDYDKTSLDDFTKLKDLAMANWAKVETVAADFEKLAASGPVGFLGIQTAYAMDFGGYNPRDEQMQPRLSVEDPGYITFKPEQKNPWENVEAERMSNPSKPMIKVVSDQFMVSQQEAQKQIELYYRKQALDWQEQVSTYENSSIITDAIAQTAKVELDFIIKHSPVVRDFVQVDNSDAVVYVTPEKTSIMLGDKDKRVIVPHDVLGNDPTALYYCSFKYLSGEGTDDPSNIVKFANWFEAKAFDLGYASVRIGDDGITVDPNVKVIAPTFLEDGIIQQLPSGFQYRDSMYNPMYEEMLRKKAAAQQKQIEEQKAAEEARQLEESHMGVWRGKVNASWMGFSAAIDLMMTIGKDGNAKFELAYAKTFAIAPGETTDFTLNGNATGATGKTDLSLEGPYTSTMKTNLSGPTPPQVAKYLKQYNTPGTLKVTGTFSDEKHVSGSISFTSQYETVTGSWSAEVQ